MILHQILKALRDFPAALVWLLRGQSLMPSLLNVLPWVSPDPPESVQNLLFVSRPEVSHRHPGISAYSHPLWWSLMGPFPQCVFPVSLFLYPLWYFSIFWPFYWVLIFLLPCSFICSKTCLSWLFYFFQREGKSCLHFTVWKPSLMSLRTLKIIFCRFLFFWHVSPSSFAWLFLCMLMCMPTCLLVSGAPWLLAGI